MSNRIYMFTARTCKLLTSTHRLTFLHAARALTSSGSRFLKVKDIGGIFHPLSCNVRVKSARTAYTFISSAVPKDVVLFENDKTKLFRYGALFCGSQLVFWLYLAHFAFKNLRTTSKNAELQKVKTDVGWLLHFEMNLSSNRWRYGFTLGCIVIGVGILGVAVMFSRRSVSRVILHKGGGNVTVYTQSPLGPLRSHHLTVPLRQVACYAHRNESPSYIPLRVKGYRMYFLLDKNGTLNNPNLFDTTVGAFRTL
ncbi:hypothetical protein DNTS_013887 [Danionella cerebrum]|uniref:Transmembrane protein 223 n=1 Tax=Danionella cerebrum TaxID=2873325 RepID=A0A553QBT4_9TELE|nr:hypothetical protein DNTS_013887 [Danionella translucida]